MTDECNICKDNSTKPLNSYLKKPQEEKNIKSSVDKILQLSKDHPVPFPIRTACLETLLKNYPWKEQFKTKYNKNFNKDLAQNYINSTYPIIHEKLVPLLVAFIALKRKSPEKVERKYYSKKTPYNLIDKLMYNRPMTFVGPHDRYMLEDETTGAGDYFDKIGKDSTKNSDFSLNKLNSYDEMKIAALVGVSGWTHFINNGTRDNCGKYGDGVSHELEGIIVGQVGPRFHRSQQMDFQDFIVSEKQNTKNNGYGKNSSSPRSSHIKMWVNLWGLDHLPTHNEIKDSNRSYEYIAKASLRLDKELYKERIKMMAEVLLIEANHRASEINKKAYVHVVGLGLGVWMISGAQTQLYVDAWAESIEKLLHNGLIDRVSFIDFSWIKATEMKGIVSEEKFPDSDIVIRFSKRDLHATVPEGCLLVCNFAWDSNTPPGNEYWMESLQTSADPAAACSSGVAELHNARINPRMCGACCRVACTKRGVVTLTEYVKGIQEEFGTVTEEESNEVEEEFSEDEDESPGKNKLMKWWSNKLMPLFGK